MTRNSAPTSGRFARRREDRRKAKATLTENRAWWQRRWSDAIAAKRQALTDDDAEPKLSVKARKAQADADLRELPTPGPVHNYPIAAHPVTGRWVKQPYRNPDRATRLAKNGRLRKDLAP